MSRIKLLTYATRNFLRQRDALVSSALASGFDAALGLGPEDISNSDFWHQNTGILSQPRGAGYWLWKPYVLLRNLEQLADNETLIYCDAGRDGYYGFSRRPEALVRLARNSQGGFLSGVCTPQHGPLRRWTKRDCLVLMSADSPELLAKPPIQATWSVWTNTPKARQFLQQWLQFSTDPRCLTDLENTLGENHADFVDHRHDQAISTILTYQLSASFVDFRHLSLFKILALRPQSRLAQTFLKRPQHSDDLLSGVPPVASLAMGQLRILAQSRSFAGGSNVVSSH